MKNYFNGLHIGFRAPLVDRIRYIFFRLYRDDGKENGNYYYGFHTV